MNRCKAGTCCDPDLAFDPVITWENILDEADDYWDKVALIEILHESPCDTNQTESLVQELLALLNSRNLSAKLVGIMQQPSQGINPYPSRLAPSLGWIGIEAYVENTPSHVITPAEMDNYIALAKSFVPDGKKIVLVTMAYDRSVCPEPAPFPGCPFDWRLNLSELTLLQNRAYLAGYADEDVIAVLNFNYARQAFKVGESSASSHIGATRLRPELKTPHREIAERILQRCF